MIQETMEISYRGIYPARAVQFFKKFHREAKIAERSRTGEVWILEEDGLILATGSLLGSEILGVFVVPDVQRRGYGRAIMNELESRARAKGIPEIHLSISLPSRKFYEGMGYDVLQNESVDVGEGQRLEYWPARKRLNDVTGR
jgi:GNAT superfamily N-acetyltransferase